MSVHVNFNLIHPFFKDALRVTVEWDFPFLPRVGESVSPRIWIEESKIKRKEIEYLLSEKGKVNLKAQNFSKDFAFDDWLYEVGIECDTVFGISYYKDSNVVPAEIYVGMYLNKDGKSI